ncbi:MAG: helix-turn-helix domain-containing protein [Bacteroidota bacterium]
MKTLYFNKENSTIKLPLLLSFSYEQKEDYFSLEAHSADYYEIIAFYHGNGHIYLDSQKVELQNSMFLFATPYQKRRWFVDQQHIKAYFITFEKDFLNTYFADKLFIYRLQYFYNHQVPPYFLPDKRIFSFKNDIMEEMRYEMNHYQNDSPHLLRAILYYMLIKLNREFCDFHGLESDTQMNNYAYQFKEILEKKFKEEHKVQFYADQLGISRISLNSAVKNQFGMTPSEIIKERLINETKTNLLHSTLTVSEIAYRLNFSEPNNLIRLFKNRMGISPQVFRTTYQIDRN